jgi:hypothetical protein
MGICEGLAVSQHPGVALMAVVSGFRANYRMNKQDLHEQIPHES